MKFSELYKLLEANGWSRKKIKGGKHFKYVHPVFPFPIPISRHPRKEVPSGTLEKILKDTGLK